MFLDTKIVADGTIMVPFQVLHAPVAESGSAVDKQTASKGGEHAAADSAGGHQGRRVPIFEAAGAGLGEQFFTGHAGDLQANPSGRHEVERRRTARALDRLQAGIVRNAGDVAPDLLLKTSQLAFSGRLTGGAGRHREEDRDQPRQRSVPHFHSTTSQHNKSGNPHIWMEAGECFGAVTYSLARIHLFSGHTCHSLMSYQHGSGMCYNTINSTHYSASHGFNPGAPIGSGK